MVISALSRAFACTTPKNGKYEFIDIRKKMSSEAFKERCETFERAIMEAICEFPNYTEIIKTLLIVGDDMKALKEKCHMRVGIPVKPMLAKPTKGV